MNRVTPRPFAALAALLLPAGVALFGLAAEAPLAGVSAQGFGQPEAAERSGRRHRRRARERTETTERSDKKALPPGMQQAAPVATYGDWNVFTNGQGKTRLCYAIAQPATRVPKTLARDTGYLFVTVRKGENVQNEIAVMFGFKPKPAASQVKPDAKPAAGDPYLGLAAARYGLVVKDENGWIQNQAEESKIVAEMSKSEKAVIKTTSGRGNGTTDEYALAGFADAIKKARDECK